jgi:hypothetical protein
MSESQSLTTHRRAAIDNISCCIYQAVIELQEQRPELFVEKYKNLPWRSARYRSALIDRLTKELIQTEGWNALVLAVKKVLRFLLVPDYFELPTFVELLKQIHRLYRANTSFDGVSHKSTKPLEVNASLNSIAYPKLPVTAAARDGSEREVTEREVGIAILLLDVENLQLNPETEKFLAEVCTYPIQIKVAFANWRNMGKQDAEYHQRGYELIHVPAGKDSADVKMATVGSSIFVHYPTAKEVFVCSSDNVLTHLCTTLQTHGLTVYLVRKQGETIMVSNSKTGDAFTHAFKPSLETSALSQLIAQLKQLIRLEQARTDCQWVKLSRISNLFQTHYKLAISQAVSVHLPGKRARDIFIEHPNEFAVHQLPEQSQLYVTLFEIPQYHKFSSNNSEKK